MPGTNDIANFIHHQKIALEYLESYFRDNRGSKGENLFKEYRRKINWILTDLKTCIHLPDDIRASISNQLNSDVFAALAIMEKLVLLLPEQREVIEDVIDRISKGEGLIVNDITE